MIASWIRKLVDPQFTAIRKARKAPKSKSAHRAAGSRPRFEVLEDRTVPAFFSPTTFAVGGSPVVQAVGDFNGDGRADLVVANEISNTVSVLLGNGDGAFQPRTDYATGATPWGVAVGDFNGDGKLDIAVANKGADSISILLGNGDGTFQPRTDIALLLTPVALTVGDFNGDGKADIAVATENVSNDSVTMMLGNGDGTFQAPVTTNTDSALVGTAGLFGGGQSSIASADFNGDGRLDLVVVNNKNSRVPVGRFTLSFTEQNQAGTVSVLLRQRRRHVPGAQNFAASISPTSVAVGDFNGDGRPDFAVAGDSSVLSVFMNSGGGNFSSSSVFIGSAAGILAAGDFNGDGATDLAVPVITLSTAGAFSGLEMFNGQAGVGLRAGTTYALGLASPVVGDFNGDGQPRPCRHRRQLVGRQHERDRDLAEQRQRRLPGPVLDSGRRRDSLQSGQRRFQRRRHPRPGRKLRTGGTGDRRWALRRCDHASDPQRQYRRRRGRRRQRHGGCAGGQPGLSDRRGGRVAQFARLRQSNQRSRRIHRLRAAAGRGRRQCLGHRDSH